MSRHVIAANLFLLPVLMPVAALAVEGFPAGCSVLDSSPMIAVVVCGTPLEQEELAAAGRAACGARLPCGAWIWTDPTDAPAVAPSNHDGLTQAQVISSQGVWVAESESFISIETVTGGTPD